MTLALLLVPRGGKDIGRLRPVEVVALYEQHELLFIETDTGDLGWGMTVDEAVGKLKQSTPGEIYLDTADYLLLEQGMEVYLPFLRPYLKKETLMVYGPHEVDLKEVAAYLRVHRPSRTIGKWWNPGEKLCFEAGKIIQKKFQEK